MTVIKNNSGTNSSNTKTDYDCTNTKRNHNKNDSQHHGNNDAAQCE